MNKIQELNEKIKNIVEVERKPFEISDIDHLLKLKSLPDKIKLEGVVYNIGGGSASTIDQYLKFKQRDIFIDIVPVLSNKFSDTGGADHYKFMFKVKGLSIIPDKIVRS